MYIRHPKGSKANPASASDSKNPNLWSPIGQPHGSGCRQCKAAVQAAERAHQENVISLMALIKSYCYLVP